jgi:hypothetical protein
LFSTSVDHQEGAFFAELNVTAERDVEVVISHGAARRSPKAELNASLEDWPELRALLLEIIAEADRLIPEVEAL